VSETHDEIRALRVMVDELRSELPPPLPWGAIEERLLSRISEPAPGTRGSGHVTSPPPGCRPQAPGSVLARVLGFAAAAAVLALGVSAMTTSVELPSAAAPPRHPIEVAAVALAPGVWGGSPHREPAGSSTFVRNARERSATHDLSALRAGDVVTAGDAPVSFGQAGLVEWTLSPGSALRVRFTGRDERDPQTPGVGYTVVLERGSLRAEVTPRDPSEGLVEAFAVEVEGTRIAVHGTAFSVQVEASSVVVDVEHGAVAVGPVGHVGATTGHLLVGPSRASFSLDGGRSARWLEIPAAPVAPAIASETRADGAATREAPPPGSLANLEAGPSALVAPTLQLSPAARAPVTMGGDPPNPLAQPVRATVVRGPAPEPPRLTLAGVRARLDRCFKQAFEGDLSPVRVSVSSTLHIDVNPDGSVRSARFDPPLKPELVQCAGSAIAGRFADDTGRVDIPVSFQP
jgi:hypothetical protein